MIQLNKSFLAKLILLDAIMILLHLLFSPQYSLFNLDMESNIPTIYQGLKLIGFGGLFIFLWEQYSPMGWVKYSLISTAIFFILLGADEMAQIHETTPVYVQQMFPQLANSVMKLAQNIGYDGSLWVMYFLPTVLLIALFWIAQVTWFALYKKQNVGLIVTAILLALSIPVIEWINTSSGFTPLIYGGWTVFEESVELFGTSLLGYAYLRIYSDIV